MVLSSSSALFLVLGFEHSLEDTHNEDKLQRLRNAFLETLCRKKDGLMEEFSRGRALSV